jgi:hypothetical protein
MECERSGTERAHLAVPASLRRLVTVMEHEEALDDEEEHEPGADERRHAACVPGCLECLGDQVEECHGDDDPSRKRYRGLELAVQAKRERAADEGRGDCETGKRDRDPAHEQRAHVP